MDDLAQRIRESTQWYHHDCELKMKAADRIEVDAKRIEGLEVRILAVRNERELMRRSKEAAEARVKELKSDLIGALARIAELEAALEKANLTAMKRKTSAEMLRDRADANRTAAEARVKELEDALARIKRLARLVAHDLVGRVETGKVEAVQNCADIARAALEGEKT